MTAIPQQQVERDVLGVAEYRCQRCQEIAGKLEAAAAVCPDERKAKRAKAIALMIRACGRKDNSWIGDELNNDEGELFEGVGNLYECGNRLCPSAMAKLRRKARRRAERAVKSITPVVGEKFVMITLTQPTLDISLKESEEAILKAFRLLRKRQIYKNNVRAAVKNLEFTITERGFHPHIHLLAVARYIPQDALRNTWTDCLNQAFAKLRLPAMDKDSIVDIRAIKNKRSSRGIQIDRALDDALKEVTKYVTKVESWLKIPDEQLLEMAVVERWNRHFELLGEFNNHRGSGECGPDRDGDPAQLAPASAQSSVHTQSLNDGDEQSKSVEPRQRKRNESLLKLLDKLNWEDWLRLLKVRVQFQKEFRMNQLVMKYPYAEFSLLSGYEFSLESFEREKKIKQSSKREYGLVLQYAPKFDQIIERYERIDKVPWKDTVHELEYAPVDYSIDWSEWV